MIDTYKYVRGTYSVDIPYIKLEDTGNRGHEFKLKKRVAKSVRLIFFSLRINNTWNRLPSVVDTPSINSFKARLDKHWTHYEYGYGQDSVHQRLFYGFII